MGSCGFSMMLLALLLSASVVLVHGQSPYGFISIDCGKPKDYSYTDPNTKITYTSDYQFTSAGEVHRVAPEYSDAAGASTVAADDLRSFHNGTRNCFDIEPVKPGSQYLVRAFFKYGNYDGQDRVPQFDLYLGVTLWKTMIIFNASAYYFTEMIALAASSRLSVCLVKTSSESPPFISALELRPVPSTMYPNYTTTSQSLGLFVRKDVGGTAELRYPIDHYDRHWDPFVPPSSLRLESPSPLTDPAFEKFQIPPGVMKTAVAPLTGPCFNFSFPLSTDPARPLPRFHLILAFMEVQVPAGNDTATPRNIDVFLNDGVWEQNVTFGPALNNGRVIFSTLPRNRDKFQFAVCKASGSLRPPLLNALEIQEAIDITEFETDSVDVDAVTNIRAHYQVQKNWSGDPCSPKFLIWDGLECDYDSTNPRIISLNLSHSELNGEIPKALASLVQLQRLDLSRNNLTGTIPDFLGSLPHLTYLNLEGNNLAGPIPKSLSDRSADGSLTLSVKGNPYFDDNNNDMADLCENSGGCRKKKLLVAIIAAVLGSVLVLTLVFVALFIVRRRRSSSDPPPAEPRRRSSSKSKLQKAVVPTEPREVPLNPVPALKLESRQFTHKELTVITNNFSVKIGKGGFGTVYHGILKNDMAVAVKVLSQSSSHGVESFHTEAQVLTRINHKNLVPLVGYCNDIKLALIYEYMPEGSLEDHFSGKTDNTKALSWRNRVNIAIDVAQGLEYMHKLCRPAIVHRDVKSSNILLTSTLEARISDFGLSKVFPDEYYTHVSTRIMGTLGYLDPEYYTSYRLTEKSDVYSFGVVLLELITGLPAIAKKPGKIHLVQWVKDKHASGDIGEIVDEKLPGDYNIRSIKMALHTALSCTKIVSIERPTMSQVLLSLKECQNLENTRRGSSSDEVEPAGNSAMTSAEILPSGPMEYPTVR